MSLAKQQAGAQGQRREVKNEIHQGVREQSEHAQSQGQGEGGFAAA